MPRSSFGNTFGPKALAGKVDRLWTTAGDFLVYRSGLQARWRHFLGGHPIHSANLNGNHPLFSFVAGTRPAIVEVWKREEGKFQKISDSAGVPGIHGLTNLGRRDAHIIGSACARRDGGRFFSPTHGKKKESVLESRIG